MDKVTVKAIRKILTTERKDIARTYGRSRDPYAQGLRDMLRFIDAELVKMLKDSP